MLALAAVAGAAGLTTYAAVVATRLGGLLAMIGVVGVAVLAAALVLRLPALVMPGLALLGAEYAGLFLVRGDTLDVRAALPALRVPSLWISGRRDRLVALRRIDGDR